MNERQNIDPNNDEPKLPFELTPEEATLLSAAASSLANEYRRSLARRVEAELQAQWVHNEKILRDLALGASTINPGPNGPPTDVVGMLLAER